MVGLVVFGFLAVAAIIAWSAKIVVLDCTAGRLGQFSYVFAAGVAGLAAYWSTNNYDYFPNANTHIYGWPVPVVVFQRDTSTSPWLDFVGPTMVLGLPMNFSIFMLMPSLIALAAATWRSWRFSLSTLLIAMTLIAVVIGLIVWIAK